MSPVLSNLVQFPGKVVDKANEVVEKVTEKRTRSSNPFRLRERSPKTWHLEISSHKFNTTFKGLTESEANKKAWEKYREVVHSDLEEVNQGKLKRTTLEQVLRDYIAHTETSEYVGTQPKKKEWKAENRILTHFIETHPWLASKTLATITVKDWNRQMAERLASGVMGSSWHREATVLRYVLYYYAPDWHPDHLPIPDWHSKIKKQNKPDLDSKRTNQVFNPDQLTSLHNAILTTSRYKLAGMQYSLMFWWSLETLVRPGAILQVKWKDIKWSDHSYEQVPDKLKAGKRRPNRTIPLSPNLYERLEAYYKTIANEYPEYAKPDSYVFTVLKNARKGQPYKQQAMSEQFAVYIQAAGMTTTKDDPDNGHCFYQLKHTGVNAYRTKNMHEEDIAYLAGWKSSMSKVMIPNYVQGCKDRIRKIIDPNYNERLVGSVAMKVPDTAMVPATIREENFWLDTYSKGGKVTRQAEQEGIRGTRADFDKEPSKVHVEVTLDQFAAMTGLTIEEAKARFPGLDKVAVVATVAKK